MSFSGDTSPIDGSSLSGNPSFTDKIASFKGRAISSFNKALPYVKTGLWATAAVVSGIARGAFGTIAAFGLLEAVCAVPVLGVAGIPHAFVALGIGLAAGGLAYLAHKAYRECFDKV